MATVEKARRLGLESAYHHLRGEPEGTETEPTHYWRDRKKDDPTYHIDYIFANWKNLDDDANIHGTAQGAALVDLYPQPGHLEFADNELCNTLGKSFHQLKLTITHKLYKALGKRLIIQGIVNRVAGSRDGPVDASGLLDRPVVGVKDRPLVDVANAEGSLNVR